MTALEKRHSIKLWNNFYNAHLRDDLVASWKYWNERLEYLEQIGVDSTHPKLILNQDKHDHISH